MIGKPKSSAKGSVYPDAATLLKRRADREQRRELAGLATSGEGFRFSGLLALLRAGLWVSGLRSRGEENAKRPLLRSFDFFFDTLSPAFDGFDVLHLSDFHFNGDSAAMDVLCDLVEPLRVDLCVMTGDFRYLRYGPHDDAVEGMARVRKHIHSRHGIVGVLGNHDPGALADAYQALGIRILMNEHVEIREGGEVLWVLGVDDPHSFRCDSLALAAAGVPEKGFKVLLAHTPEIVRDAARRGVDLYLCGHTHGGQVRLPLVGAPFVNVRRTRRLARGRWRHGGVQGYTSSGVGTTDVPVRFGCPPEVTVIRLRRGV